MTSSSHTPSEQCQQFLSGIHTIKQQTNDDFHNPLYYIHVVCLMESYLSEQFIQAIDNDTDAFQKLVSKSNVFGSMSIHLPRLLSQSLKDIVMHQLKTMVWHRLSETKLLYKAAFDVTFNISRKLDSMIDTRHDLVHRNGLTINGEQVIISDERLKDCIDTVSAFIIEIDQKLQVSAH